MLPQLSELAILQCKLITISNNMINTLKDNNVCITEKLKLSLMFAKLDVLKCFNCDCYCITESEYCLSLQQIKEYVNKCCN